MIKNRVALFALFALLAFLSHASFADVKDQPDLDIVSMYSSFPEFGRADSVIWCQPIPNCQQWSKLAADSSSVEEQSQLPQSVEDEIANEFLGSVFIVVVTNTAEYLSPEDEAFIYKLAEVLREENVEITAAAFLPPDSQTDELREWVYSQCLNCE